VGESANAPVVATRGANRVRLATATPATISGVPQHSVPASPFGAVPSAPSARMSPAAPAAYPPEQNYQDQDNDQDYDDQDDDSPDAAPIPPSLRRPQPPAVIDAQRSPYDRTGWPPAWGSQPYPGWYRPQPYPYPYYYGR